MQKLHVSNLVLLVLGLVGLPGYAQDVSSATTDGPVIPGDELNRGTPHRSMQGFLAAATKGDNETAAEYLDLRNLRGDAIELSGAELARQFYVVFQRGSWLYIDHPLDDPAGASNDNLPGYRDSIGVIRDRDEEIRLLMQKVPRGDGVSIWKISNSTVSIVPDLYRIYGYPFAIEKLREALPDVSFLGFPLFKWAVVLGVGILAYAVVFLIGTLVRRGFAHPDEPSRQRVYRFIVIPFAIWVTILSIHGTVARLGRAATAEIWEQVSPVPLLVTVWLLFASMSLARDLYAAHLQDKGRPGALVLLHPVANAVKMLIAIIAIVIYLDKLGVNIATLLAGLGVGGIAVALALQKPMEDMLAAVTLYTQQPVRVGDLCRVGDHKGTIEEIGLRTTRLRTLADTVVAVPNHRLVNQAIDNISARGNIWYHQILSLTYETTPDQLQQVLDSVRDLLRSHERVVQDNCRVRFIEFDEHSLSVEVYAYLTTTDWPEFLEMAEELNIRILEIVSEAGTSLFMPAKVFDVA
jgi:MscS family membrane protein